MPKARNPMQVSVKAALLGAGWYDMDNFIESGAASDSVVPACCSDGCDVEPDGRCEHDCPSVLLAAGLI